MKKFLTLVLALVLVFGLSVPAMAFTSDSTDKDDHPYDLSIYLVEYDDNDLFGIATLPESDRGYAKNEIVAAVVELYVPKGENPADDYGTLVIGGDNVDLDVTDNKDGADYKLAAVNVTDPDTFTMNADDELYRAVNGAFYNATKNKTYKWLVFAKVTDDEASLYAKLVDGTGSVGFTGTPSTLTVVLEGTTYSIVKAFTVGSGGTYTITVGAPASGDYNGAEIVINVDKNYKSIGMSIDPDTTLYSTSRALGVNVANELGWVNGAEIKTSGGEYDAIMDVYEDVVVDVFGMDYMLIGNYVRDSFFEDLVSADTIIATVDIEPWTAYVTVPDNIVVDPPKTGDAASIMGFVMVALSGAGAVALKKRG